MDLNLLSCYLFSICLICSLGTYNYITEKDVRVNLIQVLYFIKENLRLRKVVTLFTVTQLKINLTI